MKTALKKIYTLAPLVIVAFFFQNCAPQSKANEGSSVQSSYQGIININPEKLK